MPEQLSATHAPVQPRIIYGEGTEASVVINPEATAQTMRDLGISEAGITSSTIYVDPKNRFLNLGTHYPNKLGRLRLRSIPEIQDVSGDIVRLSTKVRGKDRTTEKMSRTMIHELEHVAQADRRDRKIIEGRIAIYGLAALGALVGSRMEGAKGKASTVIGGIIGYQLGYALAPHERQARLRAGQMDGLDSQIVSDAVVERS